MKMFNMYTPEDRALSEHTGSQILIKKASGKYSIFLPTEGTGEIGSAPEQMPKTAIGNKQETSVEGRTKNPQKTLPFYAHRDNIKILENAKGTPHDFLRMLPDFVAWKFSGTVNYKVNDTGIDALEQGELTITPTTGDVYVANCLPLVEETAVITNSIPDTIELTGTEAYEINVETTPATATLTATSDTVGAATVEVADKKVTITGVATGQALITIKSSATDHADFERSVLVNVI